MYVRGAKNRDEAWLLDRLDQLDIEDPAFRSRDYVLALDEETGRKAGFGRIRVHPGDPEACELTALATLPEFRGQGVGAHVVERLVELAEDEGFDRVYAITEQGGYFAQFGFRRVEAGDLPDQVGERLAAIRDDEKPDAVPVAVDVGDFEMPPRLRERFKHVEEDEGEPETETDAEEFGIDPDDATYKYDTGR